MIYVYMYTYIYIYCESTSLHTDSSTTDDSGSSIAPVAQEGLVREGGQFQVFAIVGI